MGNLVPYVTFAALFTGGFFVGMALLESDKLLNKYIGTPAGIFHTFQTFLFLAILAVFIIMGTPSLFGRGIAIGLLLRAVQGFTEKNQRLAGLAILAINILLLFFA